MEVIRIILVVGLRGSVQGILPGAGTSPEPLQESPNTEPSNIN